MSHHGTVYTRWHQNMSHLISDLTNIMWPHFVSSQHWGHTWHNTRHLSRIQLFISRETISGLRLEWISTVYSSRGEQEHADLYPDIPSWKCVSKCGHFTRVYWAVWLATVPYCGLVLELNRKKSQPVTSRVDLQVPWRHRSRHRCVFHDRHLTTN